MGPRPRSSARRRSRPTTTRPAIRPRRSVRRSRRRCRRRACMPTGRWPTSLTGRSSCGRGSPDARARRQSITSSCSLLAARAHGMSGDRARERAAETAALDELDPDAEPVRYAAALARLARTQWSLNRGPEGACDGAARARAARPATTASPERASLLGMARAHACPAWPLPRRDAPTASRRWPRRSRPAT